MNTKLIISLFCFLALLLAPGSPAQTTGAPGVNDFTINGAGSGGTSPVDPGLLSVDTSVTFEVSGPPGNQVFGLASGGISLGAFNFPPVVAGSVDLDITNNFVIWYPGPPLVPGFPSGNVIGPGGTWTLTIPVAFSGGETFNLQMALQDPLAAVVPNFTLTQAQSGTVQGFTGIVTTIPFTNGTQGMTHFLTVPIDFYGVNYLSIDVISHGYVKFGDIWSDFSPSMFEFFGGFPCGGGPGVPGVAVAWGDYNPPACPLGTYKVFEDTTLNTVKVEFSNLCHYTAPSEIPGTFSVTFGSFAPGSVAIDLSGYNPGTTQSVDIIVGVTDGNPFGTPNVDLTNLGGFLGAINTYVSANTMDTVGELFTQPGTPIPFPTLTFVDVGPPPGNGTWQILP